MNFIFKRLLYLSFYQTIGKKTAHKFYRHATTGSVVAQLVFADFSKIEITGLGMRNHQTAHRSMLHHHPALGQADAYLFHVQQVREDEVHAGVGERRIAHRRTDALKGLDVELLDGEPLVGSISPIVGSHFLVHLLGGSLGKPVG